MEKADRKRPREEKDDQKSLGSIPPYGSQDYWEDRYKRHQKASQKRDEGEDQPDPFHAWYFTYEELAPLILPLILGNADVENNGDGGNTSGRASMEQSSPLGAITAHGANAEGNDGNDAGDDLEQSDDESTKSENHDEAEDELEEVETCDEDDEEAPFRREGLAKGGPIEILEVGCGDVPLGMDIVGGVIESSNAIQVSPGEVVKKIVCVDYSKAVIEALKIKQKASTDKTATISLDYECEDARKLPYESGRFQLVLEKGTMDAMLSEPDVGPDNCRAIVAEMARLVAVRGIIMVISHINAQTEDGMQWLNSIIVPGLRVGSVSSKWRIEVHGGEIPDSSDGENEEGDDALSEHPGPAVYIIQKSENLEGLSSSTDVTDLPSVSLLFYSY